MTKKTLKNCHLVCVSSVKNVVVDDWVKNKSGESILSVAVGGVLGVQPSVQLVEEVLDAVRHMLPDCLIRSSCKKVPFSSSLNLRTKEPKSNPFSVSYPQK